MNIHLDIKGQEIDELLIFNDLTEIVNWESKLRETRQIITQGQKTALVTPNPQGKGLVPVLDQLSTARQVIAEPKEPAECLLDYLVSALVLSADFRFKPVVGTIYYLYFQKSWQLSLVAPEQWGDQQLNGCSRVFVGRCQLRSDFTWQMDQTQPLEDYPQVVNALADFEALFSEQLNAEQSMNELLPFHRSALPFWQRIHAHALAKSLKSSMMGSGLEGWTGRQMLSGAGSQLPKLRHHSDSSSQAGC